MNKSVLIGAGKTTSALLAFLKQWGYEAEDCFAVCLDNNKMLWGRKIGNLSIEPIEKVREYPDLKVVISSIYGEELTEQLKALGIQQERIVDYLVFKRQIFVKGQTARYQSAHKALPEIRTRHADKTVVYTAVFGGYDQLIEPVCQDERIRYVCFTDDPTMNCPGWEIRCVEREFEDSVLESRKYKLLPHRFFSSEYSIWMDANIQWKRNPLEYINTYMGNTNAIFIPHGERDCIYEEAACCIAAHRDKTDNLVRQIKAYYEERCPEHVGLFAGGMIARRHQESDILQFDEEWWKEFTAYSRRDQISLGYLLWKKNMLISICSIDLYANDWFTIYPHTEASDPFPPIIDRSVAGYENI